MQMPTNWVNKQNVVYPFNGISFNHTEQLYIDTCYNTDDTLKEMWKKLDTKGHTYYDFMYMTCPE